ncbi:hypothetical protein T439DRAFT_325933 [Meredithblackwellia eburnea MCA 4105]
MLDKLSAELIHLILGFVLISSPSRSRILPLAYIGRIWRAQVTRILFRHIHLSSTSSTRLLLRSFANAPDLQFGVQELCFERGREKKIMESARRRSAGGGRRESNGSTATTEEDAVTPEDLVLLSTRVPVEALSLRELEFTSLRRRSVNFTTSLPGALLALSISGRVGTSEGGFNLHTVGQLLTNLPSLTHLALRNIQVVPAALEGLVPPTCQLISLALVETRKLEPHHLLWLLRSTALAETLINLTLSWNESPRILNPIRYAALKVHHLALSTTTAGVPEAMVLHFPSLRLLEIQSNHSVDGKRLLENIEGPGLDALVDRSVEGAGVGADELADMLRRPYTSSSVSLKGVRTRNLTLELEKVCTRRRIRVERLKPLMREVDEPYIPPRFSALWKVELGPAIEASQK